MQKIEVKILNPAAINDAEQMMVAMARLTQRGEKITCMADLEALMTKGYSQTLVDTLSTLPHPTIQKFGVVNIAIVGASRRFLAQITRHQNEVKFMSGSLQYSDYTASARFCVPYEFTKYDATHEAMLSMNYLSDCLVDLKEYEDYVKLVGRDAAGYKMPQGMRNVLVISATPYQWKHMINQRVCNRNTSETRYVMLRCWEELYTSSLLFKNCGPGCMQETGCIEGNMACDAPAMQGTPTEILDQDFKYIRGGTV